MPLEAKGIEFGYPKSAKVLSDVSLTVEPGEVVGLIGHSGRGKTTFARILAGHLRPACGQVTVGGMPLVANTTIWRPVQMVFQHPERAVDPRWRMRRTLEESWGVSEETLRELGIENGWLDRYPNELSGGEMQRFCVARALAPKTRYLIADEMTTMLDAITQAQIWNAVLRRVSENSLGVLVISHEVSLVEHLCSRVVCL